MSCAGPHNTSIPSYGRWPRTWWTRASGLRPVVVVLRAQSFGFSSTTGMTLDVLASYSAKPG